MREIKFRAWDTMCGRWHEDFASYCHLVENEQPYDVLELTSSDSSFILVQYTGLKDKNGKEIYEGDVVEGNSQDNYPRSVIGFEDGSFTLKNADLAQWKVHHFELEIIGNIYENPELLVS